DEGAGQHEHHDRSHEHDLERAHVALQLAHRDRHRGERQHRAEHPEHAAQVGRIQCYLPRPMSDEVYRRQVARLFERSGFYREKLARAGFVSPRDAGGLADIAKLPFTEKDELRQSQAGHPPLGAHAAVGMPEVARIYSTSGTSGTPLYIPLSRADADDWREIGRKTYSRNGLKA